MRTHPTDGIEFESWRDFPPHLWDWPNFTPEEMACRGDGKLIIHAESMNKLQALRDMIGAPLIIHSAYRTREYNHRVGGAAGSMHLAARAFDVSMLGHDAEDFEAAARHVGFTGFGFYPDQVFMHIDTGPARWWGERFPRRAAPTVAKLAPGEPVPAEVAATLAPAFGKCGSPLKTKRRAT